MNYTPRVTVPVEPTEAMMKAADAVDWSNEDERASVINMWQAMLSAVQEAGPDGEYGRADIRYGLHLIANEDCDEVAAAYYAKKTLAYLARREGAPAEEAELDARDHERIDRSLRTTRAYDAVRYLRDALSATTARLTGYDWNADPDGVTKQQGEAFSAADRVFADLDAAVASHPEIELPECQACGGTGKIEEAARTTGANQHSACVRTCDDCDGCGFAPDDEPEALAAREEAPAEAGERGVAGVIMDGLWPILGGNHMDAEVWNEIGEVVSSALRAQPQARSQVSAEDAGWLLENYGPTSPRIERIANALLAQPQAREDAQPVAYDARKLKKGDQVWIRATVVDPCTSCCAVSMKTVHRTIHPLIRPEDVSPTNPAPDALRVAVEELEAIKEVSGDRAASGYNETGRLARINERCDQALAVLQAEQKGGA